MKPFGRRIYDQAASLRETSRYLEGEGREPLARIKGLADSHANIVFAGMGASVYAAIPASCLLATRGIRAETRDASELLYYGALSPCSLVILISRSGRTVEVVSLAKKLREQSVSCVAVTNCPSSPLSELCACSLWVAGDLDRGVSVTTYTGGILTLFMLASTIIGDGEQLSVSLSAVLNSLEERLSGWEELARRWVCFSRAGSFGFLARGASLASAREGALLFQEVSRRHAWAQGAAVFRQGPIEAVGDEDAVFIFAPEGRTRHLNLGLAKNLCSLGCQVLVVGPPDPGLPDTAVLFPMPRMNEFLAPLLEIIPVQFAAHALCRERAHEAGEFLCAAPTTENELELGEPKREKKSL